MKATLAAVRAAFVSAGRVRARRESLVETASGYWYGSDVRHRTHIQGDAGAEEEAERGVQAVSYTHLRAHETLMNL
eukprot:877766-Prymnesium_polylepis.1